ncbi:unnamed protein product, partial [Ilex paraguariensis]
TTVKEVEMETQFLGGNVVAKSTYSSYVPLPYTQPQYWILLPRVVSYFSMREHYLLRKYNNQWLISDQKES